MIAALLLRYFPQTADTSLSAQQEFRIATSQFMEKSGDCHKNVVLTLNNQAHLLHLSPLAQEIASTIWHRGTLVELPSGEIVAQRH